MINPRLTGFRRFISRRLAVLAAAVAGTLAHGQPAVRPPLTAHEIAQGFRNGYVLAKPRADRMATVDGEEARDGTTVWRKFDGLGGIRVIALKPGESAAAGIARLQATGRYEFVEPEFTRHLFTTPNDPDFTEQWAFNNTGNNPTITGPGIAGADIHATTAWGIRTDGSIDGNGRAVIVAVADTGALLTHTDLAANLWTNPQAGTDGYIGDVHGIDATSPATTSAGGNPTDTDGHGTHVSGIIGAVGNNSADVCGICWKAQLMELKFIGSDGVGTTPDEITVLQYALAHGAAVINASFGSSQYSQSEYAAIQQLRTAGIIVVAAAGNDGEDNNLSAVYPAGYLLDNIVTVAASDNRDDSAGFSGHGSGLVDLYAPGVQIVSLYNNSTTATATLQGTSMAAPMVTGSIALLRAQYPTDTYLQTINRLLRTVDANPNFLGRAQTGGRLDLASALGSAAGANTPFNDLFAGRAHLAGSALTVRASNVGATREAGEPVIGGNAGGASLWWDWTAPSTGTVILTTVNSAYATLLGVSTGASLSNLLPVASSAAAGAGASAVSFAATAGTTYEITVDGQNGATGLTVLNLGYANDSFSSPIALSGASLNLTSSTVGATRESGEPKILNNNGGHSLWYSWTAPSTGQFQVSAYSHDFDPLLAVYTGNALSALALVAANAGGAITGASEAASQCTCTFAAQAGTTYRITIDGNADNQAVNEQYAPNSLTPTGAGQFTLSLVDSQWQAAAGDSFTTAPAVGTDGTIYAGGADSVFYAFNPNGSVRWTATAGGIFDTTSAALSPDGSAAYASCDDGNLYAFNAATGAVLWKYTVAAPPVACGPAIAADGTLYVRDAGGSLYALTPAGALKWTAVVPGLGYAAPSIASDGTIIIGSDNGTLYAFTAAGGTKWTYPAGSAIYNAPAIDSAGNLYFGTLTGAFFSVTPAGAPRWSYQAANAVSSSPALSVGGGTVYFGCYDHQIYALNTATGAAQWTYATGGEIRASSPAVDGNGLIYVGSYDGNLYALNPGGTLNRTYATGDAIRSSPVITAGALYVGSEDHKLYAFNLGTGPAPSPWPMYMGDAQRFGRVLSDPPSLLSQPQSETVAAGQTVSFSVNASGVSSYQWFFNNATIVGATGPTLALANAGTAQAGNYTVVATSSGGGFVVSNAAVLTVTANARLVDISSRAVASSGANALIAGFVVGGTGTKEVLVRGIGPALAPPPFNVSGSLANPVLSLFDVDSNAIATDVGWGNAPALGPSTVAAGITAASASLMQSVGAFSLPANSADSALAASTIPAGNYSAWVTGLNGTSGVALAEIYDADPTGAPARLVNISARASVGSGGAVLIAGFVVTGTTSETVLLRGIGPQLTQLGLGGALTATQLTLFDANSNAIASNIGWGNAPTGGTSTVSILPATAALMQSVGAFALTPGSADSALIATLPPGQYSLEVSSPNNATGIGMVEVYEIP